MYLAQGPNDGLLLALLSMCCWGSWSNTMVYNGKSLRFELYYLNYSLGVLVSSLVGATTVGMLAATDVYWYPHDWLCPRGRKLLALAAGAIFNVANLLLVKGIEMCGLAVAFPLGIGTALVLGSLLTHFSENGRGGSMLFMGVGVAFMAVCAASAAHMVKDEARQERALEEEPESEEESSTSARGAAVGRRPVGTCRKVGVCVLAGVLMSLWSPLNAGAQDGFDANVGALGTPLGLSPYGAFFAFALGIFLTTPLLLLAALAVPLDGARPVPSGLAAEEYLAAPFRVHCFGLLGGGIWALGTLANSISGQQLSFTASYAIGQSAPMVAMAWGLLHFKEFRGAPRSVYALVLVVFGLYAAAIALIALSHN